MADAFQRQPNPVFRGGHSGRGAKANVGDKRRSNNQQNVPAPKQHATGLKFYAIKKAGNPVIKAKAVFPNIPSIKAGNLTGSRLQVETIDYQTITGKSFSKIVPRRLLVLSPQNQLSKVLIDKKYPPNYNFNMGGTDNPKKRFLSILDKLKPGDIIWADISKQNDLRTYVIVNGVETKPQINLTPASLIGSMAKLMVLPDSSNDNIFRAVVVDFGNLHQSYQHALCVINHNQGITPSAGSIWSYGNAQIPPHAIANLYGADTNSVSSFGDVSDDEMGAPMSLLSPRK